jgi:hypothetical protein
MHTCNPSYLGEAEIRRIMVQGQPLPPPQKKTVLYCHTPKHLFPLAISMFGLCKLSQEVRELNITTPGLDLGKDRLKRLTVPRSPMSGACF